MGYNAYNIKCNINSTLNKTKGLTVSKILCGASRYPGEAVQFLDTTAPLLEDALRLGRGAATRLLHPLVRFHDYLKNREIGSHAHTC